MLANTLVIVFSSPAAFGAANPAAPVDGDTVSLTGVPNLLPPNPNSFLSNANNLILTVQPGAIFSTLPNATAITLGGNGNTVNNLGSIDGNAAGSLVTTRALAIGNLTTPGSGNVVLNNQGLIEGTYNGGPDLQGTAAIIANAGNTTVTNTGTIGVAVLGGASGLSPAEAIAVAIYGGGNVNFTNSGTITGKVAFSSANAGGNTFVNNGTINGSVYLGDSNSSDTFIAITGSTLAAAGGTLPMATIIAPNSPSDLLTFSAAGTVDGGLDGADMLVLQNTLSGPGSGSGGAGAVSALQYLNFENLMVNSGTWDLSGAVVSGSTTLYGGVARFNNALAFGSGTLTGNGGTMEASVAGLTLVQNVNLTGGLTVQGSNATLAGVVSGAGGLTKNGSGTLALSGTNPFSGGLALNGGGVTLGNSGSLGTGLLIIGGSSSLNTAFTGVVSNTIQLNAGLTLNNTGNLSLAGNISGSGSLTIAGGILSLSGTNNYIGGTTLQGGRTDLMSSNALGAGNLTVNGFSSLTGAPGVVLNNNVVLNATLDLVTGGGGGALTFTGNISGAGPLGLSGASGVILNGANTFSGGFTIGGGTATVGNNTAFGIGAVAVSGPGSLSSNTDVNLGNVFNLNAGLTVNSTNAIALNGSVNGASGLTKTGTGTLTLGSPNAFLGGVTLAAGGLAVGSNASLGLGSLTVNGTSTLSSNTAVTLGNNVTLNANLAVNAANGITLGGTITGTGGLSHLDGGTLTLNSVGTFTGGTTLGGGGTLALGQNSALGSGALSLNGSGTLTAGSPGISAANAINLTTGNSLSIIGTNALTLSGAISGNGALVKSSTGTTTLSGTSSFSGTATINGGVLQLSSASALGGTSRVTVNAGGTLRLGTSSSIGSLTGGGSVDLQGNSLTTGGNNTNTTFSGVITGNGSLTHTGSGTLTLSGPSAIGGLTTVASGGTILVNGSLAGNAVAGSGGTLSGSGLISGPVTIQNGGNLGTGSAADSLTTGALTFQTGSTFHWGGSGAAAGLFDVIGTATIQSGVNLDISLINPSQLSYTLLDADLLTGTFSTTSSLPAGYGLAYRNGNVILEQITTVGAVFASPLAGSIITGGSTQVSISVENLGTPAALAMNVAIASNSAALTGSGNNLVAPNATGVFNGFTFTGTTVGQQTANFTVTADPATNSPQLGSVTVNVLDHAKPDLTIVSGNNQNVIVGTAGINAVLSLANGTAGETFLSPMDVNTLSAGLTGGTGSGIIGSGQSGAYVAQLNTATVGLAQTQSFSLNAGDQQTLSGANALTAQTANVTLNVWDHANPLLTGTPLAFGIVHQGGVITSNNLSLTNGLAGDIRVGLQGSAASVNGVSINSVSGLLAGQNTQLAATFDTTGFSGLINETLVYNFADDSTFAGAATLGTSNLPVTGAVYTGQSVWNTNGGGSWGTLATGFGANWADFGGSPGLDPSYLGVDTATFGNSLGSGVALVTLDGAAPNLKGLTFNNSAASYVLGKGTGSSTLTLWNAAGGPANIEVTQGAHAIEVPISAPDGLSLTGGGSLFINESVITTNLSIGSGLRLGGNANVTGNVTNNGILSPGNSPGTIQITGDYTQTTGGTFELEVDSAINHDHLIVSGTANLAGVLRVVDPQVAGTKISFLQAGAIVGEFGSIVMPDASLRGRFVVEGGVGSLIYALATYVTQGLDENQTNLAITLDQWIGSSDPQLNQVTNALDLLSPSALSTALDSMLPRAYESALNLGISLADGQGQHINQFLNSRRLAPRHEESAPVATSDSKGGLAKSGLAAAPAPTRKWNVWSQASGTFSESGMSLQADEDFESGAVLAGADYRWNQNFATGLFLGWQDGNGDFSTFSLDIERFNFGAYATYDQDGFYLNAVTAGGTGNIDTKRDIILPGLASTARGDADTTEFYALLGSGYDFRKSNFTFGPSATLQYSKTWLDGFRERGASPLSLGLGDESLDSLRSYLGARAAYEWKINDTVTLAPEVRLFWRHEFLQDGQTLQTSLGSGTDFIYRTEDGDRDALIAGAGVNLFAGPAFSAGLHYTTDLAHDNDPTHNISLNLNWNF